MTRILAEILRQRGLDENFLHPRYEDLFDPFLMKGMREAVARIALARERGERILIFGDYDADGVTSSTVLREGLVYFGIAPEKIEVILPDRFVDGFGLKESQVGRILALGVQLVITVDNGSGAGAVVTELKAQGVDTIITDHHEITEVAADAVAVINPQRADEEEGRYLAGVGVAFCLARALNMEKNGGVLDGQEKWLLDLTAMGTICDVMTLRESNRIISYWGMKVLAKTRRAGLRALAATAKSNLANVNAETIGFQLGPRINAAGRLTSAQLAFELLNETSRAKVEALARELEELNQKRKALQNAALAEAAERVVDGDAVIVVRGAWHEGIVGIVAGQLLQERKKPVIVLAELEDGVLKGSGRSFGEFSLAEALESCRDLLLAGGGHKAACGLSLRTENFEELRQRINEFYRSLALREQEKFLERQSDVALEDLSEIGEELYDDLAQLEPFGEGNEEPVFELRSEIVDRRILKEKHLSITICDRASRRLRLMGFFAPEEWKEVEIGKIYCVQFNLRKNEWGGKVTIEGQIVGVKEGA